MSGEPDEEAVEAARDRPRAPGTVERRVARMMSPLQRFIQTNEVSAALLLASAVGAMVLANSPWAEGWEHFLHTPVGLRAGEWRLEMSLRHWVNDGLMAVFFFLLGLEIKRELLAGELRDPARARMLVITAVGGMAVPATLYLLMAPAAAGAGWGIPMATDTAFAIGVLALLGRRVPRSLVAFLVGLAIVDDIGAVLVIALFYTEGIEAWALAGAAGSLAALVLCNVLGLRRPPAYLLFGMLLWYFVLQSGLHATIAGVLAAATAPARTRTSRRRLERRLLALVLRLRRRRREERDILADPAQHELVAEVRGAAERASTPLQRWESKLETPSALLILPFFALANAGVSLGDAGIAVFGDALVWAIVAALVGGKLVGITGFCLVGRALRFGALPEQLRMAHVVGMSLVAGMGFTISIFVADLAFTSERLLSDAKVGILTATLIAGLAGFVVLWFSARERNDGTA